MPTDTDTITVPDLRALDALVAEKVMGWTMQEPMWFNRQSIPKWQWGSPPSTATGQPTTTTGSMEFVEVPHYTTDPRDWMAVVEKMRELGFNSQATRGPKDVFVTFTTFGPERSVTSFHKDEGVATSLGALRAVTGKRVVLESGA